MLLDADTACQRLRLPRVDEPTPADLHAARTRLRGAVDGLCWATELGLRMVALEPLAPGALPPADDCVAYAADGGPVLLLARAAAVGVVRLSLGGEAGAAADGAADLTAVDLAVLDLWARSALQALAAVLGLDDSAPQRVDGPATGLAATDARLVARLAWAGDRPAGALVFAARLARTRRAEHGPTLAQRPTALLGATVTLAAHISGPPVPLAELLGLEVGDVVLLGSKTALEVELAADGETIALGRPGAQGGRMAVRIGWLSEALQAGPNH